MTDHENAAPASPPPPQETVLRRRVRAALRFALYAGPLLAWMAVLYLLSTERGSFAASHRMILAVLAFWVPPETRPSAAVIDDTFLMQITAVLRRYAAVLCYGVLTVLSVRALQYGRPDLKPASAGAAFLLSIGFAVADVFHRRHEPGRHGTLDDFWLDLAGVGVFLGGTLLFFALKRLERRLDKKAP